MPHFHIDRNRTIYKNSDFWIIISLLRGDVKFTHAGSQLWAYIKEKNVWIVEYKIDYGIYGIRLEFKNQFARSYGFDIKIK